MIQMQLTEMIKKITAETGMTEEEINEKIKAKLEQLSGLISKEGAAHIIANELGVKVMPKTSGKMSIKDIQQGMRDVEVTGKVTHHFGIREFKVEDREGKVGNIIIGDGTGSSRVVCWGEKAGEIEKIKVDDIIRVAGGYVKSNQGRNEIHMNERSSIVINPEGVTIDIAAGAGQGEAKRKKIGELQDTDTGVEILGSIVQVFDPKFFEVCPECGKRARPDETGKFACAQHGQVAPKYSYLLNAFLDDGTGNIQAVFFRNSVEDLLGKSPEEVLACREDPEKIGEFKTELLGTLVKVTGRINKNDMFDRIEFVVQSVDRKPDPDEELKRLDGETVAVSQEVQ